MTEIHKIHYIENLLPTGFIDSGEYTSQHLEKKILKKYQDKIIIDSSNQKRGSIIFSKDLSLEEAARNEISVFRILKTILKEEGQVVSQ